MSDNQYNNTQISPIKNKTVTPTLVGKIKMKTTKLDITYEKWGYEQVPQSSISGNDFPIGVK